MQLAHALYGHTYLTLQVHLRIKELHEPRKTSAEWSACRGPCSIYHIPIEDLDGGATFLNLCHDKLT